MPTSKTSSARPVDPQVGSASEPSDQDVAGLSYEQARDELIQIVARLESGGESLAESMKLFTRGEALAGLCERYLTEARATVEAAKEEQSA
ncbi:MAG: exodeoxyribonuclease VII small subunit [Propionibacteriaceae bacterium]|jgi:exodeoxyribonuclease VII small subunit|nr:exodeoxyribonuclease VII small subunit [Propionibacteriaceae bacterium]